MLDTYRVILNKPGTKAFAAAGLLSRLPIAMFNISLIIMVQIQYDSYELAGTVAAVGVLVWALQTVPTSRLTDRYGQVAVMWPLTVLHLSGVTLAIVTAMNNGPTYLLMVAAGLASLSGPLGSLTRARWTNMLDRDEDIHTAFALEGSLDEVLFIGGPALATVLATTVWAPLGLVVSSVGNLVGIAILLSQRGTEPPPRNADHGTSLGWRVPLPVIAVTFIALGLGLLFGAFDISAIAFADDQGFKSYSGAIIGAVALGSLVGGLAYGSRHWRTELWKRTIIMAVVLAVGFAVVAVMPNVLLFAIAGFFAGATIAPTITNSDTVVQRSVRRDQITEGMAWLRIGLGIGVAIGAWVAGYLIDSVGARSGLMLSAAAGFFTLGVAVAFSGWLKRGTTRQDTPDAPPPVRKGDDFIDQPHLPPNV